MADKIEPALTPEEWGKQHPEWGTRPTAEVVRELVVALLANGDRRAAAIAVLNASLYDDPRRITRKDLSDLDSVIHADSQGWQGQIASLRERIEALLPPEG